MRAPKDLAWDGVTARKHQEAQSTGPSRQACALSEQGNGRKELRRDQTLSQKPSGFRSGQHAPCPAADRATKSSEGREPARGSSLLKSRQGMKRSPGNGVVTEQHHLLLPPSELSCPSTTQGDAQRARRSQGLPSLHLCHLRANGKPWR